METVATASQISSPFRRVPIHTCHFHRGVVLVRKLFYARNRFVIHDRVLGPKAN